MSASDLSVAIRARVDYERAVNGLETMQGMCDLADAIQEYIELLRRHQDATDDFYADKLERDLATAWGIEP